MRFLLIFFVICIAPLVLADTAAFVYVKWHGLQVESALDMHHVLDRLKTHLADNVAVDLNILSMQNYTTTRHPKTLIYTKRGIARVSLIDIFGSGMGRQLLDAPDTMGNVRRSMTDFVILPTVQTRQLLAYRGFTGKPVKTEPTFTVLVERNIPMRTLDNTPLSSTAVPGLTWNLDRINQPNLPLDGAWAIPEQYASLNNGPNQAWIYIVDVGILTTHPELYPRVTLIHDEFPQLGSTTCNVHATHVASLAAGINVGINPHATLFDVRVLDCTGSGDMSNIISGLMAVSTHCTANGGTAARSIVINMSLGGGGDPTQGDGVALSDELFTIRTQCDAVIVAAAGNSATDACSFLPAGCHSIAQGRVIAVGATDRNDNFASFSNGGACVVVNAPGVSIIGASNDGTYATLSGTSMASPIAAGIASLITMTRTSSHTPGTLFADTVYDKMVNDAVPVVNYPTANTPTLLVQVANNAIGVSPPPFAKNGKRANAGIHTASVSLALLLTSLAMHFF